MKDNWLNHNTDKLLLYSLVLLTGILMIHVIHDGADKSILEWLENAFSTVLGALILILTGRVNRADSPTNPPAGTPGAGAQK